MSLQHGLFSVMARFGEQLATFHAAVPFASEPTQLAAINAELDKIKAQLLRDAESPREWNNNSVDSHLFNQWRQLGIVPSAVADDATFLRRVTLDIIGTLPSDSEVTEYLTAPRSDKRQALINRLLERPEYASYIAAQGIPLANSGQARHCLLSGFAIRSKRTSHMINLYQKF